MRGLGMATRNTARLSAANPALKSYGILVEVSGTCGRLDYSAGPFTAWARSSGRIHVAKACWISGAVIDK